MKTIVERKDYYIRVSNRKKIKDYEKYLIKWFVIFFAITIFSQIVQLSKKSDSYVSVNGKFQDSALKTYEYLYQKGKIVFHIDSVAKPDVKFLVNGEVKDTFGESDIVIDVKDGDVIEIDSGETNDDFNVTVFSITENINLDIPKRKFFIKTGIQRLYKVQIH